MALSLKPWLISTAGTVPKCPVIPQAACSLKVPVLLSSLELRSHIFRPTSCVAALFKTLSCFLTNCSFPLFTTHSFKLLLAISKNTKSSLKAQELSTAEATKKKILWDCELPKNLSTVLSQHSRPGTCALPPPWGAPWKGPFPGSCNPFAECSRVMLASFLRD